MDRRARHSLFLITLILMSLIRGQAFGPTSAYARPTCNSTDVSNKANYESDTIYELLTDRFADGDPTNNNPLNLANSYDPTHTDINKYFGGDWQGIINNIAYLKNMGITAIWITPPYDNLDQPYLENGIYYNGYHGYWAKDFFRPDEHWGPWAKFDELIATAHANGIKVVIDYAPNHTHHTDSAENAGFYRDGVLMGRYNNDTLGLFTNLPAGIYSDYLGGLLSGNGITVGSGGAVTPFTLGPYEVGVWQYRNVTTNSPQIGAVGPTIGRSGNIVTIDGEGFGTTPGTVNFGTTPATILCWTNDEIKVLVPTVTAGMTNITIVKGGQTSNAFAYKVLSGPQIQVIFHENATTVWGQNIYVTGDVYELDNWDPTKPYIPFFNPNYPEWFLPISVPASRTIQFKFIKRDSAGNVIWEGGSNHNFTTPASGTADTPYYTWQP